MWDDSREVGGGGRRNDEQRPTADRKEELHSVDYEKIKRQDIQRNEEWPIPAENIEIIV